MKNTQRPIWFSVDGTELLAVHNDERLHRWDAGRHKDLGALGPALNRTNVRQQAVSPDGTRLALAMMDGRMVLWDLRRQVLIRELRAEIGGVRALRFVPRSAGDLLLVLTGPDSNVYRFSANSTFAYWLWKWDSNEAPRALENEIAGSHRAEVTQNFALSGDGKLLAVIEVADNTARIRLHNLINNSLQYLPARTKRLVCIAFSPDGAVLAAGGLRDRQIHLWETSSGRKLDSILAPDLGIPVIEFSPDNKTLLTCDWDGGIRFWSLASRKELMAVPNYNPMRYFLLFSADGSTLAVPGPKPDEIDLWKIPSLAEIDAIEKARP